MSSLISFDLKDLEKGPTQRPEKVSFDWASASLESHLAQVMSNPSAPPGSSLRMPMLYQAMTVCRLSPPEWMERITSGAFDLSGAE